MSRDLIKENRQLRRAIRDLENDATAWLERGPMSKTAWRLGTPVSVLRARAILDGRYLSFYRYLRMTVRYLKSSKKAINVLPRRFRHAMPAIGVFFFGMAIVLHPEVSEWLGQEKSKGPAVLWGALVGYIGGGWAMLKMIVFEQYGIDL